MHRCAIKCCENNALSLDGIQKCVENCSQPLNKAQNYVQSEFEGLQSRLQRCVMDCNDTIRDKIGPNPQESDVSAGIILSNEVKEPVLNSFTALPKCFRNSLSLLSELLVLGLCPFR